MRELNKLVEWRGRPEQLRVDNGPEFIAQALQDWCGNQTTLKFIQKGKPHQNGYIERFNRTFRDEVLLMIIPLLCNSLKANCAKIADALGVSPDFLIYGSSDEKVKTPIQI